MKSVKKNITVITIVVIAIFILLKIIGWNRVITIFKDDHKQKIEELERKLKQDSSRVVLLKMLLDDQKDSIEFYRKKYNQAKENYTVITKYYEKQIEQVKSLDSKRAVELFHSTTICNDLRDSVVVTKLSNIACANVLIAEREMFLVQRDTLEMIVFTMEGNISSMSNVIKTQDEIIKVQAEQISSHNEISSLQKQTISDMEKEKKKVDKKIKRVKFMAIVSGSAAIILAAVLILQ